MYKTVNDFMQSVIKKNPGQDEFHQAVEEVVESIWDYLQDNPHYMNSKIIVGHNGIISNYHEIKKFLIEQGYSFYSETDTEIIANLYF